MTIFRSTIAAVALSLAAGVSLADTTRAQISSHLEDASPHYADLAQRLWDLAEVGYRERQSSALLQDALRAEGFRIEAPVAGLPTAFVASYGRGEPVIALLAEFDALPGISQSAAPRREVLPEKSAGHACGHHLFGAGSVAAAVAVKRWMESADIPGTLQLIGTPAEEGGSGKVYMVREGLFDAVDVAVHWHPADRNSANAMTSLANKSAKFRFRGVSTHASAAPHRGRSALDAIEAMNHMVNLLREHVPAQTRIHYVITRGGQAPNVVPDFAESFYYVRHPDAGELQRIWDRVVAAAEGAALGTGTSMEYEVIHGNHSLLPNETLAKVMHSNLEAIGGVRYTAQELDYARQIHATFDLPQETLGSEAQVQPFGFEQGQGSTDVGDVSWAVPTVGLNAATWVPGTSAHTWQAIAAGGTSIGHKGMMVAARAMALTVADMLEQPDLLQRAQREFEERRGSDFEYRALLGDRAPPLDYRAQ